ncbi:protein kinase [Rhodanobacter sp. 7MK24]|uniref:serine/threonine-protein kinase n=1 Tax=Rhodanobacter sp. 7MK24 TaxID=2775922 RepID=UPI001784D5EE|nr:protein kinase [Rhodanobacter sp. 7MK24]MBD8881511.1 protein kinase [Rhodanobacter sp. 7MK24]
MTGQLTDRYLLAKRIAMDALEIDASGRDDLIARECGGDEVLVREVRWMIAAIENSHTATLPLQPGDTVDLSGSDAQVDAPRHYRLVRRVGEGGMGVVYLAEREDGGFAQQVALKVLNASAIGSPTLLERFVRERQLLARLEHPGIARLLDGGVLTDGQPFLAMEYIEGERIDAWCAHRGLALRERVQLFLKVCAAVEYAHRNLVIHRDLKPANILVDAQGEPRLLDFGIARLIDAEAVETTLTMTGQHALTLAYASPEQIEQQPLTIAVDVYGLGMVLYQLVAGRRPWQHITTPHQLSQAIVTGEIVPPSRSSENHDTGGYAGSPRRTVPADIDAIALKALRRQASERYATVGALADDLRNWLERRPVLARRGRRLYRLRRFLQRNRWPLTAAAALVLSVLAGLGTSLYSLHQARVQQRLAEQRRQQLERMVQFQQSMYDSVDIGAMGHAVVAAAQQQVGAALAPVASSAAPPADGALTKAFAAVQATDIARSAFDTYVVTHTLDNLDHAFPEAPQLATDLRQSLARVLLGIGSYAHAARELRKVIAEREREPAEVHDLLSARADLAQALESQGQTQEAASLYSQIARESEGLAPVDELRIAAKAGSARMLVAQGHQRQALQEQQALYAELKSKLPATDHGLMQLRRDLVDTLVQMGRRSEARIELESLLALDRGVLGAENSETLRATITLAKLLRADGEFERSLALAEQVVAIRQRRLGADHPDTIDARYVAATDATKLANDPASLSRIRGTLQHVVDTRRLRYGPDNPQTVSAMTGLVALVAKQGDIAPTGREAQPYYMQAIALEQVIMDSHVRMLGLDHPHTLLARGSLASLLDKAGRYRQALVQADETLAGQRRTLAPDDPIMLGTLNMIGDIESDLGDWANARDAYRQALAARAQRFGPEAPHSIESASRLYLALVKLRDTSAAADVRKHYLDPVIAMDPATLNAAMRSVRDEAIRMIKP